MTQSHRRGPQHHRLKPDLTPTANEQEKAQQGGRRVGALPGQRPDAFDRGCAPIVGIDANRVHPEEQQQAQQQFQHLESP